MPSKRAVFRTSLAIMRLQERLSWSGSLIELLARPMMQPSPADRPRPRKVPLGFALPWTPDMRRKLATITADDILQARRLWWAVVNYPLHTLLEAKPE